jgi:hypothetical protein
MIPFWCLMPKGEKLRPNQMGSATTCEIVKIVELEFLIYSYCQNLISCGENV